MLTEKALIERQWGDFPALFALLSGKKLSTNWMGTTSLTTTVFEHVGHTLEIYALTQDNSDKVCLALRAEERIFHEARISGSEAKVKQLRESSGALHTNLERLSYELDQMSEFFADAAKKTRTLSV